MDKRYFFERNLLALSRQNPALCSRFSAAQTTLGRYKFLDTVSGEIIPALVDPSGAAHALHSTVDPLREAERIISTLKDRNGNFSEGFVVFLGLGAGFAPEAVLNAQDTTHVLVIDYDINGIAELFCSREYIALLGDPRFTLLVDPSPEAIESAILDLYKPALCGGIKALPLRSRTEQDKQHFAAASDAIQKAIEKVSKDYSVQAHFGMRWFSNILRNLGAAGQQNRSAMPVREAAICAAGPSLDSQIPLLQERRERVYIIAADTALSALLRRGVKPDAVVSIDCQHISYYHFLGYDCADIPLFLDIASPPMLSEFSKQPFFFSGGHPLAAYISQEWRPLPSLDTSGGNVTYACLSLAESLGAQRINVYGADFSYPGGRVYARGTYIYPYFERRQNRLSPVEALLSSFLYRSPFLPPEPAPESAIVDSPAALYETTALRFYRKRFEEKASGMGAQVTAERGIGIPLSICQQKAPGRRRRIISLFAPGKARTSAAEFLRQYRQDITALPVAGPVFADAMYLRNLDSDQRRIFLTLLPQAAAIRHRHPELSTPELVEAVKQYSISEIAKVLPCITEKII